MVPGNVEYFEKFRRIQVNGPTHMTQIPRSLASIVVCATNLLIIPPIAPRDARELRLRSAEIRFDGSKRVFGRSDKWS
jgi:hypothetical protein